MTATRWPRLKVTPMTTNVCLLFHGALGHYSFKAIAEYEPTMFQVDFMKRFGYLDSGPSDSEALYTEAAVVSALKKVQQFAGLRTTGVVDNDTAVVRLDLEPGLARACGPTQWSEIASFAKKKSKI